MGDNIKKIMMVCRGERHTNTKLIRECRSQMEINSSRYLDPITTTNIALGQCAKGSLQIITSEIPIG